MDLKEGEGGDQIMDAIKLLDPESSPSWGTSRVKKSRPRYFF